MLQLLVLISLRSGGGVRTRKAFRHEIVRQLTEPAPIARLPRLIGRGRALEVLLGADDIPGDLAELYGYANRSLPDRDLDAFVDSLATRIASFDKQAISETKRFADVASLPPDFEIAPEWDACLASIARPAAQERIETLMERGFHKPGDAENRLGYYVGQLGR